MQIGELAERLSVPYRDVRYVLEQGIVPEGVEESPGRGDHRQLSPAQGFWLAIVLALKQNGIRTPLARQIADFAQAGVRGISANLSWDPGFNPFQGMFATDHQWYVDVGDLKYLRMATTANPSRQRLDEFPWMLIGKHKTVEVAPVVIIRLDIRRLAELLKT